MKEISFPSFVLFLFRLTSWRAEAAVINFRTSERCREEKGGKSCFSNLQNFNEINSNKSEVKLVTSAYLIITKTSENKLWILPKEMITMWFSQVVAGEHNLRIIEGTEQVRVKRRQCGSLMHRRPENHIISLAVPRLIWHPGGLTKMSY